MLDRCPRGVSDEAVVVGEEGPGGVEGGGVVPAMKRLELPPQAAGVVCRRDCGGWGGVFIAHVGHPIQARLHLPPANREIHRPIVGVDDRVGDGQRNAREKLLLGGGVGGTAGLQVDGVEFAPAPIERVKRLLILHRKLRPVAKSHAGRRSRADVEDAGQVVGVERRAFSGAVPPAKLSPAGDMVDSGRPIPGRVEVVFHVGVVGKQLPVAVERGVEDVAEAVGVGLKHGAVEVDLVDDAAGCQHATVVAPPVGKAWQEMIFPPDLWHG